MSNSDSLFNGIRQVSADLEEMRKVQSEYLRKGLDTHFDVQKRYCELAVQILENQIEFYTTWLANLQDTVSQQGLHRFIPVMQDKQDKPRKAA